MGVHGNCISMFKKTPNKHPTLNFMYDFHIHSPPTSFGGMY